jgi:hypothetical protein
MGRVSRHVKGSLGHLENVSGDFTGCEGLLFHFFCDDSHNVVDLMSHPGNGTDFFPDFQTDLGGLTG